MKRLILGALLFFAGVQNLFAQPWTKFLDLPISFTVYPTCLFSDSANESLLIGGRFTLLNNAPYFGIAKYTSDSIYQLGCGIDWNCILPPFPSLIYVNSVTTVDSAIYVTGNFFWAGNTPAQSFAKWNGQQWSSCGSGLWRNTITRGTGLVLKEIENELYVGGIFDSAFGQQVNSLIKFDGQNWSDVHQFPKYAPAGSDGAVYAIEKFQDKLYVAGHFYSGLGQNDLSNIAMFDGNNWVRVGDGITNPNDFIIDMAVYKDQLIVAGQFPKNSHPNNPGNHIAAWDGSQWKSLGDASQDFGVFGHQNASITKLLVHGDYLYVCGNFYRAGGVPATNIARWDGKNWCSLATGFNSVMSNEVVLSMGFFGDTLFAVGAFLSYDGDSTKRFALKLPNPDSYATNCSVVGINSNDIEEPLLSPNPTTGIISWNTQESIHDVLIFDYQGRLIQSYPNLAQPSLDVSALPPGLYLLKFNMNGATHSSRLIKQ